METLRNERLELHTAEWMIENRATPEDWQNWRAEKLADWLSSVSPLIATTPADRQIRTVCRLGVSQHRSSYAAAPQRLYGQQAEQSDTMLTTWQDSLGELRTEFLPEHRQRTMADINPDALPAYVRVRGLQTIKQTGSGLKRRPARRDRTFFDQLADWQDDDGKTRDADNRPLTLMHVAFIMRRRLATDKRTEDHIQEALGFYHRERRRGANNIIAAIRAAWLVNNGRKIAWSKKERLPNGCYGLRDGRPAEERRKLTKTERIARDNEIQHVFPHLQYRPWTGLDASKAALGNADYAGRAGLIAAAEYREAQIDDAEIERTFREHYDDHEYIDLSGTAKI
jgi:hypothetical protein